MVGITRGTTPVVVVTAPMDLTGYTCYLSIGKVPGEPYVTIDNTQMIDAEYGPESKLTFELTQEQTLDCSAGDAYVQVRLIDDDNAMATTMGKIDILDLILDGVIVDENQL